MSEVNHNAASLNSESSSPINNGNQEQNQTTDQAEIATSKQSSSTNTAKTNQTQDSAQKMNWQKVAHKLREHNRKLYKQVFRLEQDLAEIDNKFNKYVEKSQRSDVLLAHQAEEIKTYQENIALLSQQLASHQEQTDSEKAIIERVSQQYELSQKQTAQLERECSLLQEKYNNKAYDLAAKEQENQELQHKLLEYEAELKNYREAAASSRDKAERHKNYPHNRYIQPWSISTIPEPKISLPKTKLQPSKINKLKLETKAATIDSTAGFTIRSTDPASKKTEESKTATSSQFKKPQSLAAVDLPTFPRPQ